MRFHIYLKTDKFPQGKQNPDIIADLPEVISNGCDTKQDTFSSVGNYLNASGTYQPVWLITVCEILGRDLHAVVYWDGEYRR